MKKLCHSFTKANNILATIMFVVSIVGVLTGLLTLILGSTVLIQDESGDEMVTVGGSSLIGMGAFILIFCLITFTFSLICKVVGKKLLKDLEQGASKGQMIGKAIALLICGELGGWIGAGIAIIATPSRYFTNSDN